MFDNLRDSSFYEEEQDNLSKKPDIQAPTVAVRRRNRSTRFIGMTPQQRFLLSFMFLIMVCVMGVLVMFVLGRMSLF